MLLRAIKDRWHRRHFEPIQDPGRDGQADRVPPEVQDKDIVDELIEEGECIPEGKHIGHLVDYDFGSTRHKGTPFVRMKVKIPGYSRHVFAFCTMPIGTLPLIKWAMPQLMQTDLQIKVRHRDYVDRRYITAEILEVLG